MILINSIMQNCDIVIRSKANMGCVIVSSVNDLNDINKNRRETVYLPELRQ